MTDSERAVRPGKRERLVAAACELVYHQGVARTTLADIATAADVPVGNVYYYFKTKEDIIGAVVHAHAQRLTEAVDELERRHRAPKARLTALMHLLAERRDVIARYGCPYGTLCSELAKRAEGSDLLAAPLMRIPLDWAERQFRAMGRPDAHDLAVELVASYHGAATLSGTLGQPQIMAGQARRLERWIETLDPVGDAGSEPSH
ncbi:TetR/AcrR family transcriptional regulator [Pseudonocardia acaciae]|uniref:TetR/AcrR family transcriptional regulator n=1 Tax=Pseudonocardia acaciae TaxID=551276 RepID=UPI0006854EA0|nr:TetR/AcrR family transcriptional regulator [Pseudonocardia acaciae]